MGKFKVGDRVKFVKVCNYKEDERLIGKVGTVQCIDYDSAVLRNITVEFDEYIDGFLAFGCTKEGHCWFCEEDSLALIEETPVKPFMENPESTIDMVNHPSHYKSSSGLETLTVIKAFTEDLVGMEAVDTAQVLKYVCRWKKKNGLEDLKKARFYLNDLIDIIENNKKGA